MWRFYIKKVKNYVEIPQVLFFLGPVFFFSGKEDMVGGHCRTLLDSLELF